MTLYRVGFRERRGGGVMVVEFSKMLILSNVNFIGMQCRLIRHGLIVISPLTRDVLLPILLVVHYNSMRQGPELNYRPKGSTVGQQRPN